MSVDKLVPNDSRVKYESTQLRGKTYSYMLGEPSGEPKGTIVLVHGFPDMGFGWRCQVPFLTSKGYRVVVPDMLGYGGTDAPSSADEYGHKALSGHIHDLARKFVGEKGQIILGGHDWGGALVWRVALWYPELIRAVFSVCTPYGAPRREYAALEDVVAAGKMLNFTYQLHLAGPEVEGAVQGEEKVRQFLSGMYGASGPNREVIFDETKGIKLENLEKLSRPSPLLSQEELDFYVERYMRHGAPQLRGPLNWYRVRRRNWEDEKPLADKGLDVWFEMPALFVAASKDTALPPSMSKGMDASFRDLSRAEVNASHWALTQAPQEVNEHIGNWIDKLEKRDTTQKASL